MSESLPYLLGDIGRLLRRRFDERARLVGATRAQWRTLTLLKRNEGLNQGALADLLEVEPITLCRMIDRLADAGLVERRRDPADRRAWRLYLTAKSRPLIDDLHRIADELVEQMLDGIAPDERDRLGESLGRVRANLISLAPPHADEAAHG